MGDAPDQPRVKRSRFEPRPGDPPPPAGQAPAQPAGAPTLSAAEKLAKAKELLAKKDALKAQLQALKERKAASTAQQDAAARAARPGAAPGAAAAKQPAGPRPEEFFDPTLAGKSAGRRKRADFDFVRTEPVQPDFHQQARLKALSRDALERQLHITAADQAQPEPSQAAAPAAYQPPQRPLVAREPVPDVEWWDAAILLSGGYEPEGPEAINQRKLTIYIEHPVPLEPPAEDAPPPPMPLLLTDKERKKLRTQRRLEKEKEKQELIRQGLLEPPKPKLKLSTFYRSLGTEAAADPTAIERQVRADQEARAQAHDDRNLANKLTPAERRDKKVRRLTGLAAEGEARSVSLFRVADLSAPQHRFKVRANAEELHLTGCALLAPGCPAVIVAEGGPKAQKKYAHVLLRRIRWAGEEAGEEGEEAERPRNACMRVWSGTVKAAAFPRFQLQEFASAAAARGFLADRGIAHYWDLATAQEPEEQ